MRKKGLTQTTGNSCNQVWHNRNSLKGVVATTIIIRRFWPITDIDLNGSQNKCRFLDYLGQTECVNVFFVSFFSFWSLATGSKTPSTWRASHSQLENLGGGGFLGDVHFGLSSYRKNPLFWVVLVPKLLLHAFGAVLFFFCSKTCFFVLGSYRNKSNDNFDI